MIIELTLCSSGDLGDGRDSRQRDFVFDDLSRGLCSARQFEVRFRSSYFSSFSKFSFTAASVFSSSLCLPTSPLHRTRLSKMSTPVSDINNGDVAWMLISTALVLLMVIGLGLFYAGLARHVPSHLNPADNPRLTFYLATKTRCLSCSFVSSLWPWFQ